MVNDEVVGWWYVVMVRGGGVPVAYGKTENSLFFPLRNHPFPTSHEALPVRANLCFLLRGPFAQPLLSLAALDSPRTWRLFCSFDSAFANNAISHMCRRHPTRRRPTST